MEERRGIRISLSEKSWKLVIEALYYVIDKPHIDDLEESRGELSRINGYIKKNLNERG